MRIKPLEFKDKFVGNDDILNTRNAFMLTTTGCMVRHNIPRDEMYKTIIEDKRANLEFPNRAEREERRIQGQVATLFREGYKLRIEETLEEFIARCIEFKQSI